MIHITNNYPRNRGFCCGNSGGVVITTNSQPKNQISTVPLRKQDFGLIHES